MREYRFVIVFRGEGLGGDVDDTDPQRTGAKPLAPNPRNAESKRTAQVAAEFVRQAGEILKNDQPANMVTLRGFARKPDMPTMEEVYGLKSLAAAVYPMYRGLARLVGMTVLADVTNLDEQIEALRKNWDKYDFFFLHFKYTDSTGEDGNFDAKVGRIEELDTKIPNIVALKPDVLIVTGDHSTPCKLRGHSWHPVPVLLAADSSRPDGATGVW